MSLKHTNNAVCAPGINFLGDSCISIDLLEDMIKIYNLQHNDKIDIKSLQKIQKLNPITYKKNIVNLLSKKMQNYKCDNQTCWLTLPFFKKLSSTENTQKLHKYTFKPKGPRNTTEWLNTFNINNVFEQYEKIYHSFKFFGAHPKDFDDLPELGIKNINFEQLYSNGINKIGFIFNLDKHYQSGSHWVALYANLNKNQIYYFDSVGHKPEKEFMILMNRIKKFCQRKNATSKIDMQYNKKQHQHGNSECGVYAISFILRMLDGESFNDIENHSVSDDEIQSCRLTYFR